MKADPYRLAREIYGIGFITADKIAREMGIAQDAPERVAAGVAYVLSQAADEGNVYLPADELARAGVPSCWASTPKPGSAGGIATLAPRRRRCGCEGAPPAAAGDTAGRQGVLAEERAVYLTPFYYGEIGVANRLRRLAEAREDRLPVFQPLRLAGGLRRAAGAHQARPHRRSSKRPCRPP